MNNYKLILPNPVCLSFLFPHLKFSVIFKFILFFKRFYLFIFRQRGREGEREGEKHQCVIASRATPTGDLAHNPGMLPDWELNLQTVYTEKLFTFKIK